MQTFSAMNNKLPVCHICDDSHRMDLGGTTVMCTWCPVPCQECRHGGTGPYCENTPCLCECHNKALK